MKKITILLILTLVSFSLFAQYGNPVAILEYYDDDLEIEITSAEGIVSGNIYYGMDLQEGDTIRTNRTAAEIRLDPNGSIIKLSHFTVFTIETLQKSPEESNNFNLVSGKIRAVMARSGIGEMYQIKTQSAVCGVRGTDFGLISIPGSVEKAFVVNGLIDYTNILTNQKIQLGSGMVGDALAEVFQAITANKEQMNELVKDVIFEQLNPKDVPGHLEEIIEKIEKVVEESEEAAAEAASTVPEKTAKEQTVEKTKKTVKENGVLSALSNILELEIGTVTIDRKIYSKAIIQPTFNIGKLKMSLYLPIVYQTNLFNQEDWYHPQGNNEWSFGSDQKEYKDIAMDILSDLVLKIRYIKWGQQRDPFFFKVGNINRVTLGHGILMKNFANDANFPAIRRVGLNLGFDTGNFGLETVANDLADPEIFGARLFIRPIGKFTFGLSGAVDINPDSAIDPESVDPKYSETIFLTAAADLDFPLMENDIFSFIFFTDIAGMLPYMDNKMQYDMMYDNSASGGFSMSNLRNYGWNAGLFGNILFIDYKLEYRYFDGVFRPSFFNAGYEGLRGTYIEDINRYLDDMNNEDYDRTVMGIYGEAGFSIFDKINTTIGYMWPWSPDGSQTDDDEFLFEVEILPGTIPVLDLYGSVAYHRTKFIPTLIGNALEDDLNLFDANTTFSGEIVYPIAPTLHLAFVISTSVIMEKDGTIIYKDNGYPKIVPVISIETRIGF